MKILLDSKYIVEMSVLSEIVEVEEIGAYNDRSYKIVGEPSIIEVIKDSQVVDEKKGRQVENDLAAKELKRVEKELENLKLNTARKDVVERILSEKRGVSRSDVEAFVLTHSYVFLLKKCTSEDVRKFIRLQKEEGEK